jgi:2-methylcitrate dehydratase PrpD
MTLARSMADFVSALALDSIPDHVLDSGRDRLLDAIATAVAGRDMPVTRAIVASVAAAGTVGDCAVFPTGGYAAPADAALVNGTAIHALLFEDYNPTPGSHPGSAVIPAALAAVESGSTIRGREGTIGDLLVAVVAGYEVEVRLGMMTGKRVWNRGFRTTPVLGAVAASAAAARAYDMTADRTEAALSMGANLSGGFLEAFAHGTMEPYIHGGIAARNGLQAAWMGLGGVETAPTTFEGESGFFAVFGDGDLAMDDFADEWGISQVIAKTYPASGGKTNMMDSAVALFERGLDPRKIDRVLVREPIEVHTFPGSDNKGPFHNMYEVQDSTQFLVAAALLGRPLTSLKTMQNYEDPEVLALTQRIDSVGEEGRYSTGTAVATIEVTLEDGTTVVSEENRPGVHAPSVASMSNKLRTLSEDAWTSAQTERVIDLIAGDPSVPIQQLSAILGGGK